MVPVIYHGGGGGVAPWPAVAAAPYVPSASVLRRDFYITPDQFSGIQNNDTINNDAKTEFRTIYPLNTQDWKTRAAGLSPLSSGYTSTGISFPWWCPANYDTTVAATFQILMLSMTVSETVTLLMVSRRDVINAVVAAPAGAGQSLNTFIGTVDAVSWSNFYTWQDWSAAVAVPMVPSSLYQIQVFRTDVATNLPHIWILGVRGSYQVTA